MAEHLYTFYCEVGRERIDTKRGIYSFQATKFNTGRYGRLMTVSDRVWRQGPKGGVKIIIQKKLEYQLHSIQYVTTDEKLMKEFMWVKLQAQPLK